MSNKIKPIPRKEESGVQNRNLKRFASKYKVEEFAEENDKVLVIFQNKVYDLTKFQFEHPGGQDIIEDYGGQDISDVFFNSPRHKHSQYAYNMMQTFLYGEIGVENQQEDEREQLKKNAKVKKEYPALTHDDKVQYKQISLDLNKGLVAQVRAIKDKAVYQEMLKNPCKRIVGTKLFTNELLDSLFNNNIGIVVLLYSLIFCYLLFCGLNLDYNYSRGLFDKHIKTENRPISYVSMLIFSGLFIFWIMEFFYLRLILQPFLLGKTFHFLVFGIHYIFPLDDARTTVQPFFSLIVGLGIRFVVGLVIYGNTLYLILSGICLGYILYEIIHYALHNKKVLSMSYSKYLRTKHAKHHFKDRDFGYQVTNHFWDKFFELNDLDEEERNKDMFGFISDDDESHHEDQDDE